MLASPVAQAGTGGHPLHVAGANGAVVAGRVAVGQVAIVYHGHGFEAPVRVGRRAQRRIGGPNPHRPAVVDEQVGAQLPDARPRRGAGYVKAVAHELLVAINDLKNAEKFSTSHRE